MSVEGGEPGRDPRVRRRAGRPVRRRVRHRRHRHGDRAPPPAARGVELVRRRRACTPARARHGRAHGAARARPPGHRPSSTSRRAPGTSRPRSSGSSAATSSRRARSSSPTGARRTTAGSAAARSTSSPTCAASPPSSPRSSGCSIGDDGQHDDELYTTFTSEHPDNVVGVAIRRLSPAEAVLAGGRTAVNDHSAAAVPWVTESDGAGLAGAARRSRRPRGADRPGVSRRRSPRVGWRACADVSSWRASAPSSSESCGSMSRATTCPSPRTTSHRPRGWRSCSTPPRPSRRRGGSSPRAGASSPSWAKDLSIGARAFNARSEELEDKPMFRKALEKRRAVVPASGYYEWKQRRTARRSRTTSTPPTARRCSWRGSTSGGRTPRSPTTTRLAGC